MLVLEDIWIGFSRWDLLISFNFVQVNGFENSTFLNSNSISVVIPRRDLESVVYLLAFIYQGKITLKFSQEVEELEQ
jgi:hypothetical protein